MEKEERAKWEGIAINILVAIFVGSLSALLTQNASGFYEKIVQPPLAPPGFVFPIVWAILFILMGVSAGIIINSNSKDTGSALRIYTIQLVLNFFWSIIFFRFEAFLFAFIWLVLLWIAILRMIRSYAKIDRTAAYLQIPYLLWVTFAGYLTFAIFLLNR